MKNSVVRTGLQRTADIYLRQLQQAQKLREVYNRNNYSAKLKILHEKVNTEYTFWLNKSQQVEKKLEDLKRDLNFIEVQKNLATPDKSKIDWLIQKYGLK